MVFLWFLFIRETQTGVIMIEILSLKVIILVAFCIFVTKIPDLTIQWMERNSQSEEFYFMAGQKAEQKDCCLPFLLLRFIWAPSTWMVQLMRGNRSSSFSTSSLKILTLTPRCMTHQAPQWFPIHWSWNVWRFTIISICDHRLQWSSLKKQTMVDDLGGK